MGEGKPAPIVADLVIISGVSGSGKSTAIHTLEDLGYARIDSLPTVLLAPFVQYILENSKRDKGESRANKKYAVLFDSLEPDSFVLVKESIQHLKTAGLSVFVLYLDCDDRVLVDRYRETRRPHPLLVKAKSIDSPSPETVRESLMREREMLAGFRAVADRILDTSTFSPHDLRRAIEDLMGKSHALELSIQTFGFKYGIPVDADLVVDVRFLPNPHFVAELRDLTGNEKKVGNYVFQNNDASLFLEHYEKLLQFLVPRYQAEGKRYLTIGIGCTGGKHRSVAIGNKLAEDLRNSGIQATLRHRDLERK